MILSQESYDLYPAGYIVFGVYNCRATIILRFIGTSCICLQDVSFFFNPRNHFLAVAHKLMWPVLKSLKIIQKTVVLNYFLGKFAALKPEKFQQKRNSAVHKIFRTGYL